MDKKINGIIVLAVLSIVLSCQDNSSFKIEYEKIVLNNGLEVILHVDPSDPIVALSVLYHVGSGREIEGRTGFAHLFEHMLFQQSQHIGKGEFFKKIYAAGGTANGFTWSDGTGYYEVVPINALETALWMESDRMGWLLSSVNDSALINEKEIVQNEKRQRYDNRPYGLTNYVIDKILYPQGHPYNWQTIGELDDIGNATLEDVREFYNKWYGPNNATLVVAGDLNIEQTKAWIEKYFGEINRGPEVTDPLIQSVKLDSIKRYLVEDNFASSPELNMIFSGATHYSDDAYAFNLLADLLSKGKNCPLYKVIVADSALAPSVSAYHLEEEIAGYFRIRIRTFPDISLTRLEKAIFKALGIFETNGFDESDLKRIKAAIERTFYEDIENLVDRSFKLSRYNEFSGSPGFINTDINNYLAVTVADVKRVYNTYIKDRNYVLTSFVPKGQRDLAAKNSRLFRIIDENIDIAGLRESQKTSGKVDLPKSISSAFDRSIEPEKGPAPEFSLPEIWSHTFSNGLKLLGLETRELPLIQFQLVLRGGLLLDPPDRIGSAKLLTSLMMAGTKSKTVQQLEDAINDTGSRITLSSGKEIITLHAKSLRSKIEETYNLVEEILLDPRWDEKEFARIVNETIEIINRRKSNPQIVANSVFDKLVYGNNILANDIYGTAENLKAISINNLKDYYLTNFSPAVSFISIAGAITKDEAIEIFKPLATKWPTKKVHFDTLIFPAPLPKPELYFVNIPRSKQSHIRIGYLAMPYNSPDYFPSYIMNYKLGGSINGYFDQILREEKGYTYGARSRFRGTAYPGPFIATAAVRSNTTAESVRIFREEMSKYREVITKEDLDFTKNALILSNARSYETISALLDILNNIGRFDLPVDYLQSQQNDLIKMDMNWHDTLRQKYLDPDKMIYLVIGDAATQLKELEQIGLGDAILLDINANEIK